MLDLIYDFSSRSVPGFYGWRSRILVPSRLVVTRSYSIWITEGLGKNDRLCCYLTKISSLQCPWVYSFRIKFECTRPRSGILSWFFPSSKHSWESFTPYSNTLWKFASIWLRKGLMFNGFFIKLSCKQGYYFFFQIEVELLQTLLYLWFSWLIP